MARGDRVGDGQHGDALLAEEQQRSGDDAEEAAVERHAALPDAQDLGRVREVVRGLVEQHEAEPPPRMTPRIIQVSRLSTCAGVIGGVAPQRAGRRTWR